MAKNDPVKSYLDTIHRFEPEIAPTDAIYQGGSIAISLKRLADELTETNRLLRIIADKDLLPPRQY